MKMKAQAPSEIALQAREAVILALQPFKEKLSGMEILAILAYTVGQAIAMQDQRTVNSEMIWDIIGKNIEAGNAQVIGNLFFQKGGSA